MRSLLTVKHRYISRFSIFSCLMVLIFVGISLFSYTAATAQVCTVDQQGADDEPGQKDVNEFCEAPGTPPFELEVSFNFDDTRWTGSNTGDGCVLFDTDNDTFANFALCVTVVDGNGQPASQDPNSPKLYSCDDDRADRCTNSVEILTFSSTCTVNVGGSEPSGEDADPFYITAVPPERFCSGTDCITQDTFVACSIEIDDFSPGEFCNSGTCFISGASCSTDGDCVPISDSCAIASSIPNSDPSDCINTETQPTSSTTTSVPTTTTSQPTTTSSVPTTTTSEPTTTTTSVPTTTTSEPTTTTSEPTTTTSEPTTTTSEPTTTTSEPTTTTSEPTTTTTSVPTTTTSQPTTTTTSVPTTTTSQPTTTSTSVPVTTTAPVTTTVPTTTTTIPSEEIPTLSEWGMIIFMTIILGLGVITILRRRVEQKSSIK